MFRTLDRECNTTRAYQRSFALQLLKTAKKKKKSSRGSTPATARLSCSRDRIFVCVCV